MMKRKHALIRAMKTYVLNERFSRVLSTDLAKDLEMKKPKSIGVLRDSCPKEK